MLKAIFFDWGSTFVNEFKEVRKEIENLLGPHGLSWESFFPYWGNFYYLRSKGNIKSDEEMFLQLKRVLQKETLPVEKIRDLIIDSEIIPNENIKIVKELKRNYKVGVISNNIKEWMEKVLVKYKIESLFDSIVISSEVGVGKPDARIFYIALNSLSVKPEETVFISDEIGDDLVGARGCGMKTIWLDRSSENKWNREKENSPIFSSQK